MMSPPWWLVTGRPEATASELRGRASPACLASGTALAPGTAAVELDAVMRDAEAPVGGHSPAQRPGVGLGGGPVHVGAPAAAAAGEVVVLGHVAVEAGVGARQFLDQPFGHQQPQVAIHGAEAHTGKSPAHHAVDPLRGRVRFGRADHVEHHPTRTGEAQPAGPDRALRSPRTLFRNGSHYDSAAYGTPLRLSRGPVLKAPHRSSRLSISGGPLECPSRYGSGSKEPGRTT